MVPALGAEVSAGAPELEAYSVSQLFLQADRHRRHTEGAEVEATDAERDSAMEEIPPTAELAEAEAEPPPITMADDAEVKEAPAPVAEADPEFLQNRLAMGSHGSAPAGLARLTRGWRRPRR